VRSGKKASAADGAAFDFFPGPGEKKVDVRRIVETINAYQIQIGS
jgi:hypothetical protein